MPKNPANNDEQAISDVTTRASTDAAYRKRLLTNPAAAVQEVTGQAIPGHFKVKFIEKDRGLDAMFVLPDLIDPSGELSSEELEAVAGGSDCWFTCGNTCQGCSNSITTESAV